MSWSFPAMCLTCSPICLVFCWEKYCDHQLEINRIIFINICHYKNCCLLPIFHQLVSTGCKSTLGVFSLIFLTFLSSNTNKTSFSSLVQLLLTHFLSVGTSDLRSEALYAQWPHNIHTTESRGRSYLILSGKFPRSWAGRSPCRGRAAPRSADSPASSSRDRLRLNADRGAPVGGRNCPADPRNSAWSWWGRPWRAPPVPNWRRTCWWAVPRKKPKAQVEEYPSGINPAE